MRARVRQLLTLLACVVLCFLPGAIGGAFPPGAWYRELAKPPLTPPGWIFPIAWTSLYLMMGVSLYLLIAAASSLRAVRVQLGLFAGQLVLNAAWSWLFFGLQRPDLAFLEIVALWLMIFACIVTFRRVRASASLLLVPYLAWVTFASYLNLALWRLNA